MKRIEASHKKNQLTGLFARYVTGAVYTILPAVIETRDRGVDILEGLKADLNNRRLKSGRLPKWLVQTLDDEIVPAVLIRTNRFLAQFYLEQNRKQDAKTCLESIVDTADAENEHAVWAQMQRLRITV